MAVNALQYVKNVGKSFGYSAIDVFKDYNPQIETLASGAKELSSDLYDKIQDFKANISNTEAENNLIGKGKDAIQELRKNLFEDLKSGNWYNKQRSEAAENAAVAEMFGFDDDDFDLDNLDFNFDDDDNSDDSDTDSTEALIEVEKESTNAIIDAMDVVGSKSSAAIANATVQSADYIAASSKQNTKALYGLNERGFHQMSTGLAAINANISSLISLGEPLTTHMQNASTFYTSASEFHKSVLEKLDTIIKLNTPEVNDSSTRKEGTLSSILNNGVLDFTAYYDMISKNIKSATDELMGFVDMVGGPDQLIKMITASPLKFATDAIVKGVIPKTIKNSMMSFNGSLENFFGAAIDKLENKNFGGSFGSLFDLVRDYIFPKNGYKDKLDTSGYNKGKAIWTGKSEKALQEVIPTYLSKIYSSLSGAPETRFDYDRGKFITVAGIKKEFEAKIKRYSDYAGGDFKRDALSAIGNMGLTKEEEDKMKSQIDDFFLKVFKNGKAKIMDINNKDFEYQSYGLDEESLNVLRGVLNAYTKINKTRIANESASEMRLQRDRMGDDLRYMESQGDIATTLFNNSDIVSKGTKDFKVKTGGLLGTDKYNHDLFFYLQGIYKFTGHVSDNIEFIGGGNGGGRRTKGNWNKDKINPMRDIPNGTTEQDTEDISKKNTATQNTSQKTKMSIFDSVSESHKFDEDSAYGSKKSKEARKKEDEKRRQKIEDDYNAGIYASEEEYKQAKQELEDEIRNRSENKLFSIISEKAGNTEQAKGARKILEKVHSIFNKPAEVISEILSAGEISMYHFLYGKDNDDEKGLFAYFFDKADKLFDKFDNFLQDKFSFSMKEWVKKMFGKAADSSFGQEVKESLKGAGRTIKNDFSNIVGNGKSNNDGEGETEPINNGQAATGRKVTKTGIVAVSEGEMIIPSDFNPYYHGTNDKKTQLKNESNAIKNFFGSYANGGTVGVAWQEYDPDTQEWILIGYEGEEIGRRKASAKDVLIQSGRDAQGNYKTSYTKKKFKRIHRDEKIEKSRSANNLKDILSGSAAKLVNSIEDTIDKLKPKKGDIDIIDKLISEENKKRLKDANISEEAVKNRGAIGAGAIIGAGASILTGLIVGPIAGAAIGAGVGLITKSEKVQKALFGDIDKETGERKGGVLPKNISNFIVKQVPSIGKGAGYGAMGGLFLGSPILGAIIGGTIGFVSSSDKAKAALFGKREKNGEWKEGLIKKDLQDKIKKNIPNIGAGVLAGMIAGPFGIVGNIMVGGALGYASTTDKFKDALLGEVDKDGKRKGGVVGEIRTYLFGKKEEDGKQGVFTSLIGIFQKLSQEIKAQSRNLFKNMTKMVRRILTKGAKSTFGQWLGRSFIGKAAKKVGGAAVGLAKLPFNVVRGRLQKVDEGLGRRALRKGYGMYNKDGKLMTAEERLEKRKELGMDGRLLRSALSKDYKSYKNFDQYLAGASEDDIRMLRETLTQLEDPTKKYDNDELKAKKEFAKMLSNYNVDDKTAWQLEKATVGKGHKININDTLANIEGLSEDDASALISKFNEIRQAQDGRRNAKANKNAIRKELLNDSMIRGQLGRLKGVDIKDDSDIRNMLDLIKTEEEARNNIPEEKIKADEAEGRDKENNENLNRITEILEGIYEKLNVSGTDGLTLNERRRQNLESKYGMSYDKLKEREAQAREQGVNLDIDKGIIRKNGYAIDIETGKAVPLPEYEGQNVAAVSEGEIILDPAGGKRGLVRRGLDGFNDLIGDRAKSFAGRAGTVAINVAGGIGRGALGLAGLARGKYHKLVGMFANGGIVGNANNSIYNGAPESFAIDKANIFIKGDSEKEWGDKEDSKETKTAKDIINDTEPNLTSNNKDHGLADEKDSVITQTDSFGNIYQMRRTEQGELAMDETDSQTQQAMDSQKKIKEALYSIPTLGASMVGVGSVLNTMKDGFFGSKEEKKEGFFSKLFDKLTGEDSFLGGIFRFITDSKFGMGVKPILGRVSLGSIFKTVIAPALGLAAITGKLDSLGETFSDNLKSLKGNDTKATLKDNRSSSINGQELAKDEYGNYIKNENGEYQTVNGDYVSGNIKKSGSDTSISAQMKKNLLTGIITGKGSVLGSSMAKGLNSAKYILTGTKGTLKSATLGNAAKNAGAGLVNGIMTSIDNLLQKMPSILSNIPFIGRFINKDSVSTICDTLYEHLDDAVKAAGSKLGSIANAVSNALAVVKVITVVGAGIDAWGNAESILGITDDATVGQKVIAVLVAVTNALIPIVGNLIPNKVLVNIFMSIAPKIGIDVSSLEEQRAVAEKEVEQYNAEYGTDYSIEEYNQNVNNKAGIITKAKNKVSSFFTNVKEQGFMKTIGNIFSGSGSGLPTSSKYKESESKGTFVSQLSNKYSKIPFGNSTIGSKGCAPAVATMLVNNNRPGSMTMDSAIKEAGEYERTNGTSAEYFKAVLDKRGISSKYIDSTTNIGKKDLATSLMNGSPTVLLGEDLDNVSKNQSPFGPNSHYVMATGIDNKGNVIISDPESKAPKKYDSSILDNVRLAISTSENGAAKNNLFNLTGSGGVPDNDITKNVYGFFTKNGFSPAAAAGILANAYAESGVNPSIIQGNGKGPAAGMFQWENYNKKSGRWLAMSNYAASKGKDWTDLTSQLEYALSEIVSKDINNRLSKDHSVKDIDGKTYNIPAVEGVEGFKKSKDPILAMQQFEAAFERAGKPNFAKREAAAKEYYNLYSGSNYTGNYDSSVGSTSGTTGTNGTSTGTESTSNSPMDILSSIKSVFSDNLTKALGGNTTSSTTSSTGITGDSSSVTNNASAASTPQGKGTAQSFIDIAKSQLGFVEEGNNITPYGKFTGTDGQAWCASFVSWCMDKAFNGDKNKAKKAMRGPYSAAVSGLWNNFKSQNAMSMNPQPGDIVIYKNNGGSHTGLVETVNGDNVTTIEGNTSGGPGYERNGGMVARKNFNIHKHSKLTGFGRPDWDAAVGAGSGIDEKLDKAIAVTKSHTTHVKKERKPKETIISRYKEAIGGGTGVSGTTGNVTQKPVVDNTVISLLKTLINLVQSISDNTSSISSIGTTITNYCKVNPTSNVSTSETKNKSDSKAQINKVDPERDPALKDLMATLSAIATG